MHIIITGTSRGIGKELAEILAEHHQVLALSRTRGKLSPNVKYQPFDFCAPDFAAFQPLLHEWGRVDVIINNAGYLVNKPFQEISAADLDAMTKVNFTGPYQLIQCCLPYMHKGGHIVNISSVGGVQGSVKFPGLTGYSSTKGALSILTECLAEEFKETGIKVNTLALGAVQTEMLEEAFPGYKAPFSAREMAEFIADFSTNRYKLFNGKIISVSSSTP